MVSKKKKSAKVKKDDNDILNKQKNNIKFSKSHSKFINRLRGMGNPKKLTHEQLSQLAQGFTVKYAVHLETMLGELLRDKDTLRNTCDWQLQHINNLKKTTEGIVDRYEDNCEVLEEQIQDLTKQRNDCLRAYKGLNTMANSAEKMGIDLAKAGEDLPEAEKNKYDFSQTDTLLESGEVKHVIKLTPKNKKDKH